jgi:hypothetical protein
VSDNAGLKLIKQVIEYGSIVGVPLASTTLQGMVPEEVLQITIPTLANSLKSIGQEFAERMLSQRENLRVGSALILAAEGIRKRLESGESVRDDGFFDKTATNYSNMDEAVESTLKKVMRTTEEPKIEFMANLIESVHFNSDLDMHTYRHILKHLEELSYRQLCIIRLCINANQINLDNLGNPNITGNLSSILRDCFEVRDKRLISSNNPFIKKIGELYLGSSGQTWVVGGKSPEYPGFDDQEANILGKDMFKFSKLNQIPDEHVDAILMELKPGSTDTS